MGRTQQGRSWWRRALLAVGALLVVGIGSGAVWLVGWIFPIGTGAAAKTVCSDVFVGGRDAEGLLNEEMPKATFVSYEVDRSSRQVHASAFGFARKTAVFRPGLGCVLAIDRAPADLASDGWEMSGLGPAERPWPRGDGEDPRPDPAGLDRPGLDAAIDTLLFQPEEPTDGARPLNTRAVVVVHRGRILAERYAEGFGPDTPQLGWSMTKSVTSALVGLLVARGKVDVHAPIGFAEWSGTDDPRRELTWDHLLRMSSGLDFTEDYGLRSDVTVMLFDVADGSALPLERGLAHPVDTHWAYSSGTTNLVSRRMREVFDDDAAYHRFPHEALFGPLGMRSAVMETDPSGTFVGSSFMYATPRDWARFGQLYLQDGVWEGERLLPEGWVRDSVAPTPTHPTQGYGAQWWLNAAKDESKRALPGVPADAYFASGHQGQIVLVVPSREAVIVRMGMTNGKPWPRGEFAAAVLDALPK